MILQAYETVLQKLNEAGKEGFLVGGSVRDRLLHRQTHDFDVTTDALPEEIKQIFRSFRTVDTGIRHGTVTVLIDGQPIEVTTYRVDGDYADRRHPQSVRFCSELTADLARRDFTINAMAESADGAIIDPFGGRRDLEDRIVRCVGEPRDRFSEDALRILRAMRFSSVLDFTIEKKTGEAAKELADTISFVSRERCFSELKKTLCGEGFERVFLESREVFCALIPQLRPMISYCQNNPHHIYTLDVHTAKTVSACPPDPALRLAALLHDVGKPLCRSTDEKGVSHFYGHASIGEQIAREILEELKSDTRTKEDVLFLIRCHDIPAEETKEEVLKRLNRFGERRYRMLCDLRRADSAALAPAYRRKEEHDGCLRMLSECLAEQKCFSLKDLSVNGNDLIAAGVPRGRRIGRILQRLMSEVIEGKLENDRASLLVRAGEIAGDDGGGKN